MAVPAARGGADAELAVGAEMPSRRLSTGLASDDSDLDSIAPSASRRSGRRLAVAVASFAAAAAAATVIVQRRSGRSSRAPQGGGLVAAYTVATAGEGGGLAYSENDYYPSNWDVGREFSFAYKAPTLSEAEREKRSLYCFSLVMASGYEVELIREQFMRGVSIFACEGWDVFSSEELLLNPGGVTAPLHAKSIGDMHADHGGPWNLALNTEVFIKAWSRVFEEDRFGKFGWTLKLDPDCVWLPGRFKAQVQSSDPDLVFYLNDCDHGLHGPIEVVARGGMRRFAEGFGRCTQDAALMNEKSTWGEDVFLRHCFKLLGISKIDNFNLLTESACFEEDPARDGCKSGKVAFHPFKQVTPYFACLDEAQETLGRTTFA